MSQGGKCGNPGCLSTEPGGSKGWHTDHNHTTNQVRGELCHACNLSLGLLKEDIQRMEGLVTYMKHYEREASIG